jgi:hypothetical protein
MWLLISLSLGMIVIRLVRAAIRAPYVVRLDLPRLIASGIYDVSLIALPFFLAGAAWRERQHRSSSTSDM